MLKRLRRTKIVVTLGPATDHQNNLEKIIIAGANVMRLNFSHGNAQNHQLRAEKVRKIADKLGYQVAILGDLQGPKIRISTFKENKVFLKTGDSFLLDANLNVEKGDSKQVGIDYKLLPNDVVPDDILLLDDGRIQLKVIKVDNMKIFTEILIGGYLSNNKGINKLHGGLSAETLTKKDKLDIITAAKIDVDYLAVSFPRCGQDIQYARYLARKIGCNAKLVAKVERAEIVTTQKNIDDIILASDAVMIARGDLGVEIGDPELVGIQKTLIRRARQLNRIIITATQMMESMVNNPMPTRAEVMDVANAVLDGTDAVMLSAETAIGNYPEETVSIMAKVCLGAEKVPSVNVSKHRLDIKFDNIEEAIAMSAMYAANHLQGVTAIITMTESGRTPLITSRITSGLPIFALSRHKSTLNLTALYRGVTPVFFSSGNEGVAAAYDAINLLKEKKYLVSGDIVIITQGDVMDTIGATNTNRILRVS
ncbi:pyruvate kinase [Candidatus Pantoea edessiphila]|uniref:Pyruvate kinase n=1 Tax=Candidatus Pantoea edessiphila TaxID=2044610 RepID=A0A2P5T0S6_9GAMM|nr:pyruvate kinase [Candidatus Pantoea edessiphila]PPI88185.1 pyruvate kinase [Candidatus Pantoea edessiphila]